MSAPKVLTILWSAITVPLIIGLVIISRQVSDIKPGVITQTQIVTPTASPSATVVPTLPVKASSTSANNTIKSTVKGGVTNEPINK